MTDRDEKLLSVRHLVNNEAHIHVDFTKLTVEEIATCVTVCPAGCFVVDDEGIRFQYEGCLECATCRIVCPNDAITWDYPLGGWGVSVRHG